MCGFFLFVNYRGADKSLARPERNKLMFLSEWCELPLAPCLAGKNLDDSSCLELLISRMSLTCFQAFSFLVGLRTYQDPGSVRSHVFNNVDS